MELIVSHVNLDFDSLAAMVAAQKLYPTAKLVSPGSQNRNVRQFIHLHQDILGFTGIREVRKKDIKRVIIVDTKIAERLGELEPLVKSKGVETFIFDHHPPTPEDMKMTRDFTEPTGATTTILVKILRDKKITISPFEATLFALGIHEDTGSLTYPSSTYEDAEVLAYLMMKGANIGVVHRFLDFSLDQLQHKLLNDLLDSAHVVDIKGIEVIFTSARVTDYVDSAAVLTHKVGDLENIDVVFSLLQLKDRINVIGRSRIDQVDVAQILSPFGGGGHPQAASAVVRGGSAREVERKVIAEISKKLKAPIRAGQIMLKLVPTVAATTSVKKARDKMRRFNLTSLPVLDKGKLAGIITIRDTKKAAAYNLAHAPVKGFMSYKVVTITKETPLQKVIELLGNTEIGQLPVVENDKIIGVVSRREVLKAIHGASYLSPRTSSTEPSKKFIREEIISRLDALLPHKIRTLLSELGELAEQEKLNIYLVGGFVRDLLMNHRNLDIDLVVEGDGIAFARKIVKKLGGRLTYHEKFATAVVILPDDFRIDVASARTEFYEHPAALPQVELGTVRQDLFRRDFTINAMAIALNTPNFGELLDYFGGEKDIEARQIGVLHELSFVDDPTRIFRAARFEQRYGFKMSYQTEKLARAAVEMELLGELTQVRVRDEIMLILSEPAPWWILRRLEDLGVLKSLHPKLKMGEKKEKFFREINNTLLKLRRELKKPFQRYLVYLSALIEGLSPKDISQLLASIRVRATDTRTVIQAVRETPRLLKVLKKDVADSRLYRLLEGLPREVVAFVYAHAESQERDKIRRYFTLQGTSLEISGDDFIRLGYKPSEDFKKVLDRVLDAKLNGKVTTKEEELLLAQQIFDKLKGKKG